jgi:predicted nuclease of predicted toxin-antitoxin system
MRWVADECVDADLVRRLRRDGHDILYVAEIAPGVTDTGVAQRAQEDRRLLLTEDKDFGELIFRSQVTVPGLVLLRIAPGERRLKLTRMQAAVATFGERLYGRYLVVEPGRFRSRPLQTSG